MDFTLQDHFSLLVLTPNTPLARVWVDENLPSDATHWHNGVVIEPRYIGPIVDGLLEEGFTID